MRCRLLLACGFLLPVSVALAADVTLRVECDQPQHKVSDRLIGIFFEDINFGADGGLNAELVKNGSFELPPFQLGWKILGNGHLQEGREAPIDAANATFLRIRGANDGDAGVVNEGFRGMGIREGQKYSFSMHARSSAETEVPVTVRLVSQSGETVAQSQVKVAGSAWKEVSTQLVPSRTDAKATLQVLVRSNNTVDIDLVSLCPQETWKSRPGGLRKDLVQLLADLKPAFFRFPGGCIVEGSQLKYRYQWKTTIGPREGRRPIINRWNTEFNWRLTPDYYQSFDIGFYEYFQLAEDLGAEPLPIVSCGMACQFNTGELVPLEELQPYIQDALDLIEFANGSIDSEWGSKRAAMGHPEPFNMRLLGVGNEQWGPEYFDRYQKFAEVLQREHPEIELISTSGPFPSGKHFDYAWPLLKKLNVPIVDEHCYAMPDWFLREATRYDNYDRAGPKVFMGEYAAQSVAIASPNNRNNVRCAIAEAAFLTGIERNSDVVTMSAYAPLMAHVEAWQWTPDLIWFDNLTSYATPNYYVQQLFSLHTGDVVLPVAIEDPRPKRTPGGRIALGTFNASTDFREVSISKREEQVFHSSELDGVDSLTLEGGEWSIEAGAIQQTSNRGDARALFGDPEWADYDLRLKARKRDGRGGIRIVVRVSPGGSHVVWNLGGDGNKHHNLVAHIASHSDTPQKVDEVDGSLAADQWYDLRVSLQDSRIRCYVNEKLVHDANVPAPATEHLYASATLDNAEGDTIVKVVNPTDAPASTKLLLQGLSSGKHSCQVIAISGPPDAMNSIDSPDRVRPKESKLDFSGDETTYEFPPHSLTVMRVKNK